MEGEVQRLSAGDRKILCWPEGSPGCPTGYARLTEIPKSRRSPCSRLTPGGNAEAVKQMQTNSTLPVGISQSHAASSGG
jgi:hypothetical protein